MLSLPSPYTAARAINFCATSPQAVVLTVWPSGTGHLNEVQQWLEGSGAKILHASPVPLASPLAELLSVMAIYDGEEWLESNCWYMEQPLPNGPPDGPYAGGKWKQALCFKNTSSREPHAIVCDVGAATSSLWSGKYSIRSKLARLSHNPGNSCIHLTDQQSESVLAAYNTGARKKSYGMGCDDSYAYACARALLHPASVAFLNSEALASLPLGESSFRLAWKRYTDWLHEPRSPGATEEDAFDVAPSFL